MYTHLIAPDVLPDAKARVLAHVQQQIADRQDWLNAVADAYDWLRQQEYVWMDDADMVLVPIDSEPYFYDEDTGELIESDLDGYVLYAASATECECMDFFSDKPCMHRAVAQLVQHCR